MNVMREKDEAWMRIALDYADQAASLGEVPVGAIVVADDRKIGSGFNQPIARADATAHAEIVALRNACEHRSNYRLPDATLYVTVEPCMMCAGALVHARIKRLVFGATEPKAGAVCSHELLASPWFNHQVDVTGAVLADICGQKMSEFFASRRK